MGRKAFFATTLLLVGCPRPSNELDGIPPDQLPNVERIRRFDTGLSLATLTESGVLEFHGPPELRSWLAERGPIEDIWLDHGACVRTAEGVWCKHEELEFRVEAPTEAEVIDVDWSGDSLCAATSDGALWCSFGNRGTKPLRRYPISKVRDVEIHFRSSGCARLDLDFERHGAQCWINGVNTREEEMLGEFCKETPQTPGCEGLTPDQKWWAAPIHDFGITRDIAIGEVYACVLAEDGVPHCHDKTIVEDGPRVGSTHKFEAIHGMPPLVEIEGGLRHVCGRSELGEVWCWGSNDYGQLGLGTTQSDKAPKPVQVSADQLPAAQAIAIAKHHGCSITDGQIWCWGWLPWSRNDPIPTEIPGIAASELDVLEVGNCARVETGWKCWGGDIYWGAQAEVWKIVDVARDEQDEDTQICFAEGEHVVCHERVRDEKPVVRVPGEVSVHGSSEYGCALTKTGEVHCWEYDGPAIRIELPGKQVAVSVVFEEACALDDAGGVRCWDRERRPIVAGVTDIVEVHGGLSTGCARDRAGTIACWGPALVADPYVKTGLDGPVTIQLPAPVVEFGVGRWHGCARLDDGRVFCWGDESNGQRARLSAEYANPPRKFEFEKR